MSPRRILAVKLADFGDALLTTPALRVLRQAHPEATLDVLTTPAAAVVYRNCGFVDDVLLFEKAPYDRLGSLFRRPLSPLILGHRLRARRYDVVVLFHHLTTRFGALKHAGLVLATGAAKRVGLAKPHSRRGWFLTHTAVDSGFDAVHEVEAALAVSEASGAPATRSTDRTLAFLPGPAACAQAAALLSGLPAGVPRVALHPGSGPFSPARRWSAACFARVAEGLAARGARLVLVGTGEDGTSDVRSMCRAELLDLTDRTDLPMLAAVLARMDVLVCNDSGVMHLAAAAGTPVVAVFGPSNPTAWGPWWPGEDGAGRSGPSPHRVIRLGISCQPCFYRGHRLGSPGGCASRDCLAWLPADRVTAAAEEVLSEPRPRRAAEVC